MFEFSIPQSKAKHDHMDEPESPKESFKKQKIISWSHFSCTNVLKYIIFLKFQKLNQPLVAVSAEDQVAILITNLFKNLE